MSKLETLLAKEMTRQQFLLTLGMGVVSFFGFSSLMGLLSKDDSDIDDGLPNYGKRNYGP